MLPTLLIVLTGVALGIFSAVLPLGPVTVLVLQRAMGRDFRGALAIGFGRVPAESLYCGLATFGVVALLDRFPGVRFGIEALGTVLFFAIGIWLLFPKSPQAHGPVPAPDQDQDQPAPAQAPQAQPRKWGNWSGFIISILNPTLLLSWSGGVAIGLSMVDHEPTLIDKIALPLSLALGIATGYTILVGLIRRFGEQIEARFVRRLIQLMGLVFIAAALSNAVSLLRA